MKTQILQVIICFAFILGCNPSPTKKNKPQNKETLPETIITKDSIFEDEYMGHKLRPIREKCAEIDEIIQWTAKDKRKIEYNGKRGKASYYFIENTLIKTELWMVNEKRDLTYYFDSGDLIFIHETFPNPNPEGDEAIEIVKQNIYIENNNIIRLLNNMDCGSPFAQDYLQEETEHYINELEFVLSRLN